MNSFIKKLNNNTTFSKFISKPSAKFATFVILFWIIVGLMSIFFLPYDPYNVDLTNKFLPPSFAHIMGTDQHGRDIFSRILSGAKISFWLSFFAVSISLVIGVILGCFSGYYNTKLSGLIMRIMDSLQAFPMLILVMAISIALGRNSFSAMIAVGIAGIPQFARLMYAQVLSVKSSPFIEGEHAIGMKNNTILFKHVLPNCLTPLLVRTALNLGFSILTIASLSFLGIGVQPPTAEWGAMISESREYINDGYWWMTLFPGLAIASLVFSFNLISDNLRDALDYKMN